jgi:GNAT superfamily N-acetyltransferase
VAIGYEPRVRPATDRDLAELERLVLRSRDHLAAEKGGGVFLSREARSDPVGAALSAEVSADDSVVLVGCLGDVVTAYATAAVERTASGPLAVVRDLYVEPEARGVGLGRLLMEHLVTWATEEGCAGIDAEALPGDRATKNFFEGFGLVARKITVHRDLRADPTDEDV